MRALQTFHVIPSLPARLERLRELAYNLRWSWDHETIELFRRLDRELWEETYHNPVLMLGIISQERLEEASEDEAFLTHLERVCDAFDNYMQSTPTWGGPSEGLFIAYFSAEYGLTNCLPIYSGGLGILAGDHMKSASDLGLPLVGVGLLYQEGYFRQYINSNGWQFERYPKNDFYNLPLRLEMQEGGVPVKVKVEYPGRIVKAQVWRAQIGRVPIFFLDANLEENSPDDRAITSQLYGGDIEMRIRQDIMLGIGGVRALKALGLNPTVFHINEGHAAFLALERIRILMEERGLSFEEARELASAGNVFTTHTPLPSGIDAFPQDLMEKYFSHYYQSLGISKEDFLSLGRLNPDEPFNMAILALRLSSYRNGVSKLHGEVTRRIWKGVWRGVPEDEVPIHSISNGIHPLSWVSYEMASLFDHYLGPRWRWNPADPSVWEGVEDIPDEELWLTHERRRERLIAFARRKLKAQLERQGAPPRDIEIADEVLNPEALTIGFGRRFTSYKRHTLILRNPERLSRILNDKDRPVQLIFAGKAHPRDHQAKEMLKKLIQLTKREEFRRRIVFIEDYDMCVARFMVQGADVWLNTPRRFQEASGTSGMKAVANGVLNMSILDGWWDEAYKRGIGWAIGRGEVYDDYNYQDDIESNAIYDLLEKEVIPLFYERDSGGLPRKWISMMKESIRSICPYFNTDRMVREYVEKFYLPASSRYRGLHGFGAERAKALSKWKEKIRKNWQNVSILSVEADVSEGLEVGSVFEVCARVYLGQLTPEDVSVELYFGPLDPSGEFVSGEAIHMTCTGSQEGAYTFSGSISCRRSGRYGYTIRILPRNDELVNPFELGLIIWA